MSRSRPLFLILDAHNMIFKAYHGLERANLTNEEGEATGAVFGFVRMIKKLQEDFSPDYMAVAFDSKGATFRSDLYPEYKANRPPMPEDLRPQVDAIHDVVEGYGIPKFAAPGYEADDVIARLAKWGEAEGWDVRIASSDKDLAQLVNERVHMLNITKGLSNIIVLDEAGVEEKFGVKPDQIIDYLSMVGDSSDNVPGVPGVGAKTAATLLQEHGTLARIQEIADTLTKRKVGEKIKAAAETIPLSQELITLVDDFDLPVDKDLVKRVGVNTEQLRELFTRLGFHTFMRELGVEDTKEDIDSTWFWVVADEEAKKEAPSGDNAPPAITLADLEQRLEGVTTLAVDTETTSLDQRTAELVGISLSWKKGEAYYLPTKHASGPNIAVEEARRVLGPILGNPEATVIGHNFKYDLAILRRAGFEVQATIFDTMVAAFLTDPTRNSLKLDNLIQDLFGYVMKPITDLIGKGKKQTTFDTVDLFEAVSYAAEDADMTLRLHERLQADLANAQMEDLARTIEMPLIPILEAMEETGVAIDREALEAMGEDLKEKIAQTEERIYALSGKTFNIGSPKQLSGVLFEDLGFPTEGIKKTTLGYSTNEANLKKLAKLDGEQGELIRQIQDYRSLAKIQGTYVDGLLKHIRKETGRIHTTFQQCAAETGRISSTEPNLQNIPIREGFGQNFRRVFAAPEGRILLAADYSQIELRILAHVAEVEAMVEAFRNGEDIHARTAGLIFNTDPAEVTRDQRRIAKTVNFGIDYGMTPYGLSERLEMPVSDAKDFIKAYFTTFPEIKQYIDEIVVKAKEDGAVSTLFGRRRPLPEIRSSNHMIREAAKRKAMNMPIQGAAADIIKMAMIACDKALAEAKVETKMILQIHDELLFEGPAAEADEVSAMVSEAMEGVASLSVPLKVDVGRGQNWLDAH